MVLPELSYRVPLKPISGSKLCTRTRLRRERLVWGSQRTGALRGGSEDSGSSSSSIDLEAEEEDEKSLCDPAAGENQFKHAGQSFFHDPDNVSYDDEAHNSHGSWCFDVQSRTRHVPPIHGSTLGPDGDSLKKASEHFKSIECYNKRLHCEYRAEDADNAEEPSHRQLLITYKNIHEDEATINERTIKSQTDRRRIESQTTAPKTEINRDGTYNLNHDRVLPISSSDGISICDWQCVRLCERRLEDCCADNSIPCGKKIAVQTAEERNLSNVAAVSLPQPEINTNREEQTVKVQHPVQGSERQRSTTCRQKANVQTDRQSPYILANKDQSIPNRNQAKSHQKSPSPSAQVKDKTRKNPELIINGDKSCTRVKEKLRAVKGIQGGDSQAHSKRANPASLGTARAPKHQAMKALKGGQLLKRPGLAGMPKTQSAVDFITYKDMFQQIQSSDKGPAIYEMFAGPVYDNLRGSSSADKVKLRQVQSAKVTHTPVKKAHRTTTTVVKGKPKPALSRLSSHLKASSKSDTLKKPSGTKCHGTPEAESAHCEHVVDRMLSAIGESLAEHGTVTLRSSEKTLTEEVAPVPSKAEGSHHHTQVQDTNKDLSADEHNRLPAQTFAQASQQLKINTWTLSSGSEINPMSPAYKRFLDEIGDGPFTDDLLQCLAEKLISLDERDTSLQPRLAVLEPGLEKPSGDDAPSVPKLSEVHSLFVFTPVMVLICIICIVSLCV